MKDFHLQRSKEVIKIDPLRNAVRNHFALSIIIMQGSVFGQDLAVREAATLEDFEKAVRAERYYELNFENKIWFDMLRTREVRNDLTKQCDPLSVIRICLEMTFTKRQLLFPVPQREIDNNRNLVQNPGF